MEAKCIIIIIFFHFLYEKVFQNEKWFQLKSEIPEYMLFHNLIYTFSFLCLYVGKSLHEYDKYKNIEKYAIFVIILFGARILIDSLLSIYIKSLNDSQKIGSNIPNFGYNTFIFLDYTIKLIIILNLFLWL